MISRLLSTVLLFLAVTAWGGPLRIELDSLDATPGTPEGVWRLPSGTIFEIKARSGQPGVYDLVLLHSSDLSVPSGASFGHMTVGADSHTYDASLLADPKARNAAGKGRRRDFSISFDAPFTRLTLRHYRKGLSVNFVRLVPYLFRVGLERHDERPRDLVGAWRCDATSIDYPVKL